MTLVLAAFAMLVAQPPAAVEEAAGEIVVTARRPNTVSLGQPIEHFRRHCFDPQRRTGRFLVPDPDTSHWQVLDEEVRQRLGITDPTTILMEIPDHVLRHSLVLRMERLARAGGLTEHRCTLTVIGGASHPELQAGMAELFRGPGTQRHVGHPAGSPRLAGWSQHVWTAMPQLGSASWRDRSAIAPRPGGTFLVVIDPGFYDEHSYVLGDLKTRSGGASPVSILSLAHTVRTFRR